MHNIKATSRRFQRNTNNTEMKTTRKQVFVDPSLRLIQCKFQEELFHSTAIPSGIENESRWNTQKYRNTKSQVELQVYYKC